MGKRKRFELTSKQEQRRFERLKNQGKIENHKDKYEDKSKMNSFPSPTPLEDIHEIKRIISEASIQAGEYSPEILSYYNGITELLKSLGKLHKEGAYETNFLSGFEDLEGRMRNNLFSRLRPKHKEEIRDSFYELKRTLLKINRINSLRRY